ncbi:MAG: glucose 1-dehydrogenase [Candidatus Devosia phytovorans]|uniref:Glucose 1-dehydrogenase n=1 Tax=Candidatus Devosia phytovorans TaxID=3121372 RepID=A0AAJ6AZT6_9HYPH|nr:glucose 1-dehydrogenase [Devosia sp.]WEK04925.1 MAG: glucose 1-dehydrogenase [Devosia sp.]
MNGPAAFDLTGRRALVTGGSRGLGQAIAVALAKMGAAVCVTSRDVAALDETLSLLAETGNEGRGMVLDVRNAAGVRAAVDALDAEWPIDILVNNAGFEHVSPSLDVDEDIWDAIVDTNLKGSFFASQAVARHMAGRGRGAIVNLCSLTSYVGIPKAVPYGASKSGLLGMTRALSAEWATSGIRVNAIAPGYFRTQMTEGFYADEGWANSMRDKIPQRRFGEMADIGGAVVFLVSDAAAYVTGQCIAVDGGYLASI